MIIYKIYTWRLVGSTRNRGLDGTGQDRLDNKIVKTHALSSPK